MKRFESQNQKVPKQQLD